MARRDPGPSWISPKQDPQRAWKTCRPAPSTSFRFAHWVPLGGAGWSGFCGSRADDVQDLLQAIARVSAAVSGRFGRESWLDGMSFRGAVGIGRDGDVEVRGIGGLCLGFGCPTAATTAV